jgi:V/A-type H+/Na+-transporting ATPase subunit I
MRHVSIVVAKDQVTNLLAYAGSKKLLHLTQVEDQALPEGVQPYEALELVARASTVKNRIATLRASLQIGDPQPETLKAPIDDVQELSRFLDEQTFKLEQKVRKIEEDQGRLQTDKEQASELSRFLSGLENVGVSLDALSGSGFLTSLVGEASTESIPSIQKELDHITSGNLVFAITNTTGTIQTFLAIFQDIFAEGAKKAVAAFGAKLGPPWVNLPSDPKKAKQTVDLRLSEIDAAEKSNEDNRRSLAKEEGPTIQSLAVLSEILDARSKALAGSSSTESTALLQAWVPERKASEVSDGISKACNGLATVYVEDKSSIHQVPNGASASELVSGEAASAPTLVRAPVWTKPLQSVIDNFGTPDYNETNPLLFMIVTFPVMYGLMFGDFGEGPLILLLGLFLWRVKKQGKKIGDFFQPFVNGAELIVMLAIGITIFGVIFGDFFGFDSSTVFGFKPLFSPIEGQVSVGNVTVPRYMVFTLAFGVFHLLFGMSLGVYNLVRRKEWKEAFFGPFCAAWFYAAGVFVIAQIAIAGFKFSIALQNPIYVPMVVAPLILSAWKEGGMHAMELFIQSISNTFSYLRIWALNLADFYVKFAIFLALGGPAITPLSLVGAALGNLLVMLLEGLIVFVQDLRLHWVEWFGKFYEGTGFPFSPYHEPTPWRMPLNG